MLKLKFGSKITYAASCYDFTVNTVMVINFIINKTFGIHDLLKKYSCYWEDINTFNPFTFTLVRTDKNQFTQIKNNYIFTDLTVIQALTDNNKFMIKKIYDIYDIDKKWARVSFDLFKVNKIYQVLNLFKVSKKCYLMHC